MGGLAWLVLLAACVIVGSVHYFGSAGTLAKARYIVVSSAILAILVMAERYVYARNELGELLKIEYGSVGTFGGLLLALYGSLYLVAPENESSSNNEGDPG
jgi:small neutral amino acid transporter SnatA (MarC family)